MTGTESIRFGGSHEAIEARAADFLQRRRLLRWTDADRAELDAWLAESTAHRVAYLRLEDSESLVERVADSRSSDLDRLTSRGGSKLPFLAIAASLGFVTLIGLAAQHYFAEPPDRTYSTEVGGRALLSFADRTQIELNTNTAVRFRMTDQERTVWLEKGEAWFHVAHNARNPFTVVVGNRRVTDLGTEFLVRSEPGRFEVALLNGRAQLSTGGEHPQYATLTPGDEAVATPVGVSFTKKTPAELADELAWQHGILKFRHTRLRDAVNEFNRYNRTKLVIDDPVVAAMPIGGDFRTDSVNEFLRAMEVVLKLHVEREGANILLARAPTDAKTNSTVTRSQ